MTAGHAVISGGPVFDERGRVVAIKVVEVPKVKDELKARSDWWLVVLTAVLAVTALVQAGVFVYQGVQLRETVKATRANVGALMNAERAHLSFEKFKIIDERSQGQRLYPTFQGETSCSIASSVDLKNYGRTPATITVFWITPIVVDTFRCGELFHPKQYRFDCSTYRTKYERFEDGDHRARRMERSHGGHEKTGDLRTY